MPDADLTPLIEALEHGRDGYPRWIAASASRDAVISAATSRGFVALTLDAYARARILGEPPLAERTLLLIDGGADASRAHAALLQAAAGSPRPHLLLTLRHAAPRPSLVREARSVYAASVGGAAVGPERAERVDPQVVELLRRAARARELARAGRHAAAERLLRDSGAALARRGARHHAARVAITLARMLGDRGRTTPAVECLEQAITQALAARCDGLAIEGRLWQAALRIGDAALVEAEGICRAVLEAPHVEPLIRVWAQALLADTLLWQGRVRDVTDVDVEDLQGLEPGVAATVLEIRVRLLLARGETFEAGACAERLVHLADETDDATARVLACHADLARLAAGGDVVRAEQAFERVLRAAHGARTPLRAAWARILWVDMLRRLGRKDAAAPHLESLKRFAPVAPALLRREIARRTTAEASPVNTAAVAPARHAPLAIALLRMTHDDEDDRHAMKRLLGRVAQEVQASRLDVVSNTAGPVSVVCSIGDGLPTRLGARVLETGFAIGPERQAGGLEIGVPVRFGPRALGALVCRWPIDRVVPPEAAELLELAAVIAAPRLDGLQAAARDQVTAATAVPELLGVSDAMAGVRKAIVRAAAAPFNILIEGESGVGKELAARAVHHLSPRRERKFCDVNCAALPEELLESELFGHARGAFSGAVADRAGLFEEADGGTLFLDEVADLSARAQAKLLRAIQQQEVRRVGESFSRKVDVRIIAAANRDMRAEVSSGRFRHDLLYRLDVVRLHIPPLRERPADIGILAEHCWSTVAARTGSKARLSATTLAELARYHWPGNVRELQNVIASLAVGAPVRGWVRPGVLPAAVGSATTVSAGRLADAREQFERRFVEVALARAGGNRAQAARALGLSRQGLLKILARLGLDTPSGRGETC